MSRFVSSEVLRIYNEILKCQKSHGYLSCNQCHNRLMCHLLDDLIKVKKKYRR